MMTLVSIFYFLPSFSRLPCYAALPINRREKFRFVFVKILMTYHHCAGERISDKSFLYENGNGSRATGRTRDIAFAKM